MSQFLDYEDQLQFGYDWLMAPPLPRVTEYRQSFYEAQLKWLECWQPRTEH